VLEVQRNMKDSMKAKALEMQRINDELKENEEVLKKANAQLAAQAEEFERMNRELSTTNQELVDANTKLQELDKMKDDFVTVAAEELCSPLVPILESVDAAESGTLSEEEAWKTIVAESKRLGIVASSIVDVSRIEDGTYSYDMHPVSVKQLLDGIVQTSSGLKGRDGVTANIKLDSDPAGDVMIVADKKRLHHALGGIINNSIRFSKNAAITIGSRANHLSGSVDIRIADNGPRFPTDLVPELFNKYTTRTREDERGTGLGLFITKAIIGAHGGTIKLENHKGARTKGVSFMISLPMKVQKVQPTSAEAGAGAAN
jgi:signal transduction histidine kinase